MTSSMGLFFGCFFLSSEFPPCSLGPLIHELSDPSIVLMRLYTAVMNVNALVTLSLYVPLLPLPALALHIFLLLSFLSLDGVCPICAENRPPMAGTSLS